MPSEPLSLYRALVLMADNEGYWEGTRQSLALQANFPLADLDMALVRLIEWHKVFPIGTSLFGDEVQRWYVAR